MPQWPHAPSHFLGGTGAYIVTAGTYRKAHHFRGEERLDLLLELLMKLASQYHWDLEAWAVFSNHYHFVAQSPNGNATSLQRFLQHLHSQSAREINTLDGASGRKVWHNYRETQLTYDTSYYARLHYVHTNPVKHGLVKTADAYRWCSAGWFQQVAEPAQVRKIYSFPVDQLNIDDDY